MPLHRDEKSKERDVDMTASTQTIENQTFDAERSLYHLCDATVKSCAFDGPADGESVLKECRRVTVSDCRFSLRYPLWHAEDYTLADSVLDEKTRAPIWYASHGRIINTRILGVKCLRECEDTEITGSEIISPEFGWRCRRTSVSSSELTSEYLFFESSDLRLHQIPPR